MQSLPKPLLAHTDRFLHPWSGLADFPDCYSGRRGRFTEWLRQELARLDHIFIGLILGCGVHGALPSIVTTTTTSSTRLCYRLLEGGEMSARSVPCRERPVVTATLLPGECLLPWLRGHRNAAARVAIAEYAGVRRGTEVQRLRKALGALDGEG